jgi:zinc transport system ATP-binding protein
VKNHSHNHDHGHSRNHATPPALYVGPDHVGEEVLCVEGLAYAYPDGTEALRDVSLHVRRGSTLAIVGPNGAGKTTLLKIILGLLSGYRGEVLVNGLDPAAARRRGDMISWVPQRAKMHWDFPVTVRQVVGMGLVGKTGLFRRYRREDLAYVEHLIATLDIAPYADKPIGEVSGGQQQRAIIARALAPHPAILMLDEPTVGVDQSGQELFKELMRQIRRDFDVTLVIVSHDLRAVLPECERIACLNRTLHFHDAPSRLTPELLGEVFRCDLTGLFGPKPLVPRGQSAAPPAEWEP